MVSGLLCRIGGAYFYLIFFLTSKSGEQFVQCFVHMVWVYARGPCVQKPWPYDKFHAVAGGPGRIILPCYKLG